MLLFKQRISKQVANILCAILLVFVLTQFVLMSNADQTTKNASGAQTSGQKGRAIVGGGLEYSREGIALLTVITVGLGWLLSSP